MQMSLAKWRLSGPARTLVTSLRWSAQQGGCVDGRRCGAFDRNLKERNTYLFIYFLPSVRQLITAGKTKHAPQKCPPSVGVWNTYLTRSSLNPREFAHLPFQTASRLVQPFWHSSPVCPTRRPRYDRHLQQRDTRRPMRCMITLYNILFQSRR